MMDLYHAENTEGEPWQQGAPSAIFAELRFPVGDANNIYRINYLFYKKNT